MGAAIAVKMAELFQGNVDNEIVEADAAEFQEDFGASAETITDAAEQLAKVDRDGAATWEGYKIAAGLTAVELRSCVRKLEANSNLADADARMRVEEAERLARTVQLQCPNRALRSAILGLFTEHIRQTRRALRKHRAAQWHSVLQLMWRFRSTVPFLVLSSGLSVVLGACSALRVHYQASVLNLAREALTGNRTAARAHVGEAVGAMAMSEIISQLLQLVRSRLAARGTMNVVRQLKIALFQALTRQDLSYLEQCEMYQQRSLIGSCNTTISRLLDFPALVVEASIRFIAALVVLWKKSPKLTAFVVVALPVRLALNGFIEAVADRFEQRSCPPDFTGQINACWSALVRTASIRTMRAFAREPTEVSSFGRFLAMHDQVQEHKQLVYRVVEPVRSLLENSIEIFTYWIGGRLAVRGELDFGDLTSFVVTAQGALDGVRYVHAAAATLSTMAVGPISQMSALLARKPCIGLDEPPLETMPDPHKVAWRLKFENVSFAYPQRPGAWILRKLSFEANEGQFTGIVGETGAGKSTIFVLLLRFYDPAEGRIFLDGRDLREYNPLWLRRHIGYVSQDLTLSQKTIRDNLMYGCVSIGTGGDSSGSQEPADEVARAALKTAQVEDRFFDANAFPSLWHTEVGDGGSNLSGGERQRLGIARAVLKAPRLLLLDEATSALDETTQANLRKALEEGQEREGWTVIVIAHRLSTLSRANQILVLEDGALLEAGTPDELSRRPGGRYSQYVMAQTDVAEGSEPSPEAEEESASADAEAPVAASAGGIAVEALREENENLRADIEDLRNTAVDEAAALARMQQENDYLRRRLAAQEEDMAEGAEPAPEAEEESDSADAEAPLVASAGATAVEELREENENLRAEIEDLRNTAVDEAAGLARMQQQNDYLRRQHAAQEEEIAQKSRRHSALQAECSLLCHQLEITRSQASAQPPAQRAPEPEPQRPYSLGPSPWLLSVLEPDTSAANSGRIATAEASTSS